MRSVLLSPLKVFALPLIMIALAILGVNAFAADSAGRASAAQIALIEAAISAAQPYSGLAIAYDVENHNFNAGEKKNNPIETARIVRLRFDPTKELGAQWGLLSPLMNDLTKDESKFLEGLNSKKNESPADNLTYDDLKLSADQTMLVREDETYLVVRTPLIDDDTPDKIKDALEVTVSLNKTKGFIEKIETRATKPFKPAPVAKVKQMEMRQTYAQIAPGGPVLMVSRSNEVRGKAMLSSFHQKGATYFSNFDVKP